MDDTGRTTCGEPCGVKIRGNLHLISMLLKATPARRGAVALKTVLTARQLCKILSLS